MFLNLLKSRQFAPLFWCQFFSAFNDNFVRQMIALMILFRFGVEDTGALVSLAIGIFVLPSLFLSGLGGEIADSHDKAKMARVLKFAELLVQAVAALGFYLQSIELLFVVLFGLGVLAALFGPIKYGILPDQLKPEQLPSANALIEGATFIAIVLGLLIGGYVIEHARSAFSMMLQLMGVALACWLTSLLIPYTARATADLKPRFNVFAATGQLVSLIKADQNLWLGGVSVSLFWMTGAIALSLIPLLVKQELGGGVDVETAISALFALGVGVGSIMAAIVAHGKITMRYVSAPGLLMSVFLLDLAWLSSALSRVQEQISLTEFFVSFTGLRLAVDVVGLAAMAGLFVVPAFAAVQSWAKSDQRARVVAGVNILNAIFMVAGSAIVSFLQSSVIGATLPTLLVGVAFVHAAGVFWVAMRSPDRSWPLPL